MIQNPMTFTEQLELYGPLTCPSYITCLTLFLPTVTLGFRQFEFGLRLASVGRVVGQVVAELGQVIMNHKSC
jgi:hypothetical protein